MGERTVSTRACSSLLAVTVAMRTRCERRWVCGTEASQDARRNKHKRFEDTIGLIGYLVICSICFLQV